jgi:hypothetical protein
LVVSGFPKSMNASRELRFPREAKMTDEIDTHGIKPAAFWLTMTMILTVSAVALTVALYGVLR